MMVCFPKMQFPSSIWDKKWNHLKSGLHLSSVLNYALTLLMHHGKFRQSHLFKSHSPFLLK